MFRKVCFAVVFAASLSACSYVDEYERQVTDWEPVYCYKSLAATTCYREPKHSDNLRLVNYYGPHPSRYDAPEPLKEPDFKAPEPVDYWVKDAEPVPRAMPHGDLADRPWLTTEGREEQLSMRELRLLSASGAGTQALLRRISLGTAADEKSTLPQPDLKVE